jgi:hypothetical protein
LIHGGEAVNDVAELVRTERTVISPADGSERLENLGLVDA